MSKGTSVVDGFFDPLAGLLGLALDLVELTLYFQLLIAGGLAGRRFHFALSHFCGVLHVGLGIVRRFLGTFCLNHFYSPSFRGFAPFATSYSGNFQAIRSALARSPLLVVVPTSTALAPGRSHNPEHRADDGQDHADCPKE